MVAKKLDKDMPYIFKNHWEFNLNRKKGQNSMVSRRYTFSNIFSTINLYTQLSYQKVFNISYLIGEKKGKEYLRG